MAACTAQAPITTSVTAEEVAALQRHKIAAVRIISNQQREAGYAANKLSGPLLGTICSVGRLPSNLLIWHGLPIYRLLSHGAVPAEKSMEVNKLQKQVEALEQRLFFAGPFKSSAVAAEDTAARRATSKSSKVLSEPQKHQQDLICDNILGCSMRTLLSHTAERGQLLRGTLISLMPRC